MTKDIFTAGLVVLTLFNFVWLAKLSSQSAVAIQQAQQVEFYLGGVKELIPAQSMATVFPATCNIEGLFVPCQTTQNLYDH